MAQHSSDHLSQRRVGVVFAIGAGLYASFRLYNAYVHHPATTIRRSNAVRRRQARRNMVSFASPTPDAPLGTIIIRENDRSVDIDLATMELPSVDMFREIYGSGSEAIRGNVQELALKLVLSAASTIMANLDVEGRLMLENRGLGGIATAMLTHSHEDMLWASIAIKRVMHLDILDEQQLRDVVDSLSSTGDSWMNDHRSSSSSDDEDRGPADTEEDWETGRAEPGQGLRGLLYYIAENDAKRKAYEHRGITCDECGDLSIRGVRWRCLNCPDFDLCSSCETHTTHPKTHVFAKIKIPVPVLSQPTKQVKLWYPGDPQRVHLPLSTQLKKELCDHHEYDEPQLDAMYDQFTCLANVPWEHDPKNVTAAIDRRAFNRALTSDRWPPGLATNAMYDRMFAFYDTDDNGLIGFTEFVDGIAYLRGPKRFASLRRTIQGYDLDGDGYVNREDFLRILRAKHVIQKQLISDQVDFQESEKIRSSMDILQSSQPISSIFNEEGIPPGETRRPCSKHPDLFGDLQPSPTTRAVLDDDAPYVQQPPAREQLRGIMSRFEEHIWPQATGHGRGNDNQSPESPEEKTNDLVVAPLPGEDALDPYMQDILWQIEEKAFNELLDLLFKAREEEEAEIARTQDERMKWTSEIRDAIAAEARSQLMSATSVVKQSLEVPQHHDAGARQPEILSDSIAPGTITNTDRASLARREAQIAQAPLEDLLQSLGAGLRDDGDVAEEALNARVAHSDSSAIWDGVPANRATSPLKTATISDDNSADPSLLQPKPNALQPEKTPPHELSKPAKAAGREAPSKARLIQLARLSDLEREMHERGGPGRLSYSEVEHMVVGTGSSELRGMVKSWLEWASF